VASGCIYSDFLARAHWAIIKGALGIKFSLGRSLGTRPQGCYLPTSFFLEPKGPAWVAYFPTAFRHHVCGVSCALALLCLTCSIERRFRIQGHTNLMSFNTKA
jgi:hypothetical protein